MKVNCKCYFPSIVVVIVTAMIVISMPAFAGGSSPEKINSVSDGATLKVEDNIESDALVTCPEPRPQMCTMDYRPVCAQMKDGSSKEYSNGCTSCSDPNVSGYRDGACKEAK